MPLSIEVMDAYMCQTSCRSGDASESFRKQKGDQRAQRFTTLSADVVDSIPRGTLLIQKVYNKVGTNEFDGLMHDRK